MPSEHSCPAARARCTVCPHACRPAEGTAGFCRSRTARDGRVIPEGYGRITSLALDPIEKKPLARFMPGTRVLSLGSYGCNMHCPWCQNASISQAGADDVAWQKTTPQQLVDKALELKSRRCAGIAYTYNEPFVNIEFLEDCARLAHENDLVNVVVSNGMVETDALRRVLPLIDAANIDLKAFRSETYRLAGGDLDTVKRTIETIDACPTCHLEITWLVIPQLTDDDREFDEAVRWIAGLSPDIPLHVSRFFPRHQMLDRLPTDIRTVYALTEQARAHLHHVFTGNC